MTYIATRYESDGEFTEHFEAESMAHAEEICDQNGWMLDGELVHAGVFEQDFLSRLCN